MQVLRECPSRELRCRKVPPRWTEAKAATDIALTIDPRHASNSVALGTLNSLMFELKHLASDKHLSYGFLEMMKSMQKGTF